MELRWLGIYRYTRGGVRGKAAGVTTDLYLKDFSLYRCQVFISLRKKTDACCPILWIERKWQGRLAATPWPLTCANSTPPSISSGTQCSCSVPAVYLWMGMRQVAVSWMQMHFAVEGVLRRALSSSLLQTHFHLPPMYPRFTCINSCLDEVLARKTIHIAFHFVECHLWVSSPLSQFESAALAG